MGRSCQPQLSRRPWLFPWPWLFCLVAGPAVMAAAVGAASVAGLAVPAAAGGAATVAGPVPTAADVGTATVADLVEVTAAAAGLAVTGSMPVVWPDLFVHCNPRISRLALAAYPLLCKHIEPWWKEYSYTVNSCRG